MTLLGLLLFLVVLGVVGVLIQRIPMDGTVLTVIRVVIGLVAVFVCLRFFGLLHWLDMRPVR